MQVGRYVWVYIVKTIIYNLCNICSIRNTKYKLLMSLQSDLWFTENRFTEKANLSII